MGEFQLTGDKMPLRESPAHKTPEGNPGNGGQFQLTGDEIGMSRKTVLSPSSDPPNGQFQIMGSEASLSRKPIKGWGDAASLTMSGRSIEQSRVTYHKGKKR
jgi:hypothetical protein